MPCTKWVKIFSNHIFDELISRICKQLLKLKTTEREKLDLKMDKGLDAHFSKEIKISNRHLKGYSKWLLGKWNEK